MSTNEKKGTLAVLALVFGIAGIVVSWIPIVGFLGFALSIAAIVMGAIELSKINKGTSSSSGKGFAITGLILGIIAIVLSVVFSIVLGMVLGGLFWSF
jgi:hypothetical protein